jgi:hypothetical protein
MDSLGVVYPQFWLSPNAKASFKLYLKVIKFVYYVPKKYGRGPNFNCVGPNNITYAMFFVCFDNEE